MLKHKIFLQNLVFAGAILFATTVLISEGWLQQVFASDQSGLSMLIVAIYLIMSLHWLYVAWQLSNDRQTFDSNGAFMSKTKIAPLLAIEGPISQNRVDTLVERIQNRHMMGHFASDALLKLGLLGTIIGFILMLLPIGEVDNFDVTLIQTLMISMSKGMGIALYTTLAGLVTSTLTKFQYLILDRAASELVSDFEDHRASQLAGMPQLTS